MAWAQRQMTSGRGGDERDRQLQADEDGEEAPEPPGTGKHHGERDNAVTVPDLLERAVRAGGPLRLNWPGKRGSWTFHGYGRMW